MNNNLRQLLAIFLLSIFLIPGLSKVKMVVDFKINQDYIAKVFCINKDIPSTMCFGKCYIGNQLQKVADKENNDLPNQLTKSNQILLFLEPSIVEIEFDKILNYKPQLIQENQTLYTSSYLKEIFHPPQLI